MIETLFTAFFTICMMVGVYVVCSAIAKAIIKIIDSIKEERKKKEQATLNDKICDNCKYNDLDLDQDPCYKCERFKYRSDYWEAKEVSDD